MGCELVSVTFRRADRARRQDAVARERVAEAVRIDELELVTELEDLAAAVRQLDAGARRAIVAGDRGGRRSHRIVAVFAGRARVRIGRHDVRARFEAGGRDDFGAADGALASTTRRRSALEPTSMAAKRGIRPKPSGKRPCSASARVERERFLGCAAMDCGGRRADGRRAGCCCRRAGGRHGSPRPYPTATGRGRDNGRAGVGAPSRRNSSIRTGVRPKRGPPRRRKHERVTPRLLGWPQNSVRNTATPVSGARSGARRAATPNSWSAMGTVPWNGVAAVLSTSPSSAVAWTSTDGVTGAP